MTLRSTDRIVRKPRSGSPIRTQVPSKAHPSRNTKPTRAARHAATAAKTLLEKKAITAGKSPIHIGTTIRGATPIEKPGYPMRINKYLAQKGYATRKAADELIAKRRVFINNKRAVLGDKVLESDAVEVRLDKKDPQQKLAYFVYNKPRNVITHSAQNDESEIREMVPELVQKYNVFPIGRLDKDSHGLIILTNDGRITDRLLSPTHEHEKEYVVKTKSKLRDNFKTRMEEGVNIEGYQTKPTKIKLMGDTTFNITLTEGKKHQIRRMVVALFNEVQDLQRTRVLNVELGKLKSGEYRAIEGDELSVFLKSLGL
jgi:23S rRNA pseudouridine2604 synthase